ncbi:hypothetical protein F0225_11075 [Vibrio pectenicida]|uniref:Uncharacterized protein n=1 Tax=Vibrio pectenicida TaxID=62763 RepID=A0A7Y3ZZE2_9VIBR|nr:hypothetical protein [Vibrio pectenicida]NOH71876.1 hypothetical protein [Vibrio pectenicida]
MFGLKKESYKLMLENGPLEHASEFLKFEFEFLKSILCELQEYEDVVVVGSGNYKYYDIINEYGFNYIGIDPYNISEKTINLSFEDYAYLLKPVKNRIYLFWFNVISHIDLNKVLESKVFLPGDVIINSTWSNTPKSEQILEKYYKSFDGNYNASCKKILNKQRSIKDFLFNKSFYYQICNSVNNIEFTIL